MVRARRTPPPADRGTMDREVLRDRHWIYLAVFVRAAGASMLAVLAGAYLRELRLDAWSIATIGAAGFAGCLGAAAIVTVRGDRWGRRRSLAVIAVLAGGCSGLLALAPTGLL